MKSEKKKLKCPKCEQFLGYFAIYETENSPAYNISHETINQKIIKSQQY